MNAGRVIEIMPEPFGAGFDVEVLPPLEGESFDREYPTYQEALGWAGGLRLTHGWRVVDKVEQNQFVDLFPAMSG